MRTIRIDKEEMDAFAAASGDLNPLHLRKPGSAPQGTFDAPVAYGALAVLLALGELTKASDRGLRILKATFARPLRVGVEYEIQVRRDAPSGATALIRDGDLTALTLEARFSGEDETRTAAIAGAERLRRPRRCGIEELEPGTTAEGVYGSDETSLRWIRRRFRLRPSAVSDAAIQALLCVSYLVGMVIPGSGSMISRLQVSLLPSAPSGPSTGREEAPLSYRVSVVDLRPQVRMATLAGELRHGGRPLAKLSCEAHVPVVPSPLDLELLEVELGGASRALEGRTAIVVGAGRGLGAALGHGLASQGCAVYACSRSGAGEGSAAAPGRRTAVHHVRGDASDPAYCRRLLERVEDRHGGLDFLLCCGAPRLDGIGFGPTAVGRFNGFVQQSFELVSVPLATMIHSIETRAGACVVVSSAAVRTMPREWGHYVAAKGAGEALAAWAAKRFPRVEVLVARVPQLDGGPLGAGGDEDAVARESAAAWLVRGLMARSGAGGAQLLEWPG